MNHVLLTGNENTRLGSHLSSAYITVSFGPPKLTVGSREGIVVGLIQDLTIYQQRQVVRLFEIYNNEQWLIPTKTRNALQMRRVLYDGPSLMKYVAYAMASKNEPWTTAGGKGRDHDLVRGDEEYKNLYKILGVNVEETDPRALPGTSDFWINLASEVFSNSIGILLRVQQEINGHVKNYGAVYLEDCLIAAHTLAIMAENRILTENVQIEFAHVVPLQTMGQRQIKEIELALGM